MSGQDNPKLVAEIDPNGENMELDIRVEQNGVTYEDIQTYLSVINQNQYSNVFERPILTLLTLAQRQRQEQTTQAGTQDYGDTDLDDLSTDV